MTQYTLIANDILYISFYLKEKDPSTGSITPYDLSSANSIVVRIRQYRTSTNTLELAMSTIATPAASLGFCRVLATVPSAGTYSSEVQVYDAGEAITWRGPVYIVDEELG